MLFFDIEANGLLDTITEAHCMVIMDDDGNVTTYRPAEVEDGAMRLLKAIKAGIPICGHNIINYDIPALEMLYPNFRVPYDLQGLCVDTLVLSRLICGNIKDTDTGLLRAGKLPPKLLGSHSLKAWGYRLGELKGSYGEQEDAWDVFTEEMLTYCSQDVLVDKKVYEKLMSKGYPEAAIELEHEAQWLMCKQERNGFNFNKGDAEKLEVVLRTRHAELDYHLRQLVPQIPDKTFIPKRDNKTKGYKAGVPVLRYKEFNPNSRQQIDWLINTHYQYKPDNDELYKECQLKIDDETFSFIATDTKAPMELREVSKWFSEYLMITKRLGQLIDGKYGWLKCIGEDGAIHGRVNPCGAVTGRATHSSPNVAQVPAVKSPYGHECRALFQAPEGWYQVGVDACGLELRCLAHFMFPFDKGKYAHEVINGDVHTVNQTAAGLPDRDKAKRFIYAYLYGGGDVLIGRLVNGGAKEGKKIKKKFLDMTPALKDLKNAIRDTLVAEQERGMITKWRRRYLKGLDGRPMYVRSFHSALNLLLQGAGALICKYWIVQFEKRMIALGYDHGKDFRMMAWVHDEMQVAARTQEIAEVVVREAKAAMQDTQVYYKFKVELDTEGKVGKTWNDCH